MTNYDYIKNISLEKLGHYLCDKMDSVTIGNYCGCEICPVNDKYCRIGAGTGKNGFIEWLKEEHKDK